MMTLILNHNPNCTNEYEFTNNTNGNKIQNANLKMQNDNSKLKINKIQTPVIARSGATKQSLFPTSSFRHCKLSQSIGTISQILINKKRYEAIPCLILPLRTIPNHREINQSFFILSLRVPILRHEAISHLILLLRLHRSTKE